MPANPEVSSRLKRLGTLAIVIVTVLTASGCGGPIRQTDGSADDTPAVDAIKAPTPDLPVEVKSADGKTVKVSDISRIVVLRGPIAEVVYALGLGDHVVGRDVSTTLKEAADVELVTHGHDLSAEAVLSLHPTLVLADSDAGPPEAIDQLRATGTPVVIFEPTTSVESIGPHITEVARALGVESAGEKLARTTQASIDNITAGLGDESSRPRVAFLYLRGNAGVYLLGGPGSGADSMIQAAGGIDVGTEMKLGRAFTPLTSEALVKAAPDIFLLTTTGLESVGGKAGLLQMSGVAQTPAGQTGRVVTMEDGLLYSFGTRTPDAVENLAKLFRDAHQGQVAEPDTAGG